MPASTTFQQEANRLFSNSSSAAKNRNDVDDEACQIALSPFLDVEQEDLLAGVLGAAHTPVRLPLPLSLPPEPHRPLPSSRRSMSRYVKALSL